MGSGENKRNLINSFSEVLEHLFQVLLHFDTVSILNYEAFYDTLLLFVIQASPEENQEGNFGSEHSASPSQGSSQQQFLEVETNVDDSMDIQQQVKRILNLITEVERKTHITHF